MSIESDLESISATLDRIAENLGRIADCMENPRIQVPAGLPSVTGPEDDPENDPDFSEVPEPLAPAEEPDSPPPPPAKKPAAQPPKPEGKAEKVIPKETTKEITYDQMRAVALKFAETRSDPAARVILAKFGAKSTKDLKPEHYAEVVKAFKAAE